MKPTSVRIPDGATASEWFDEDHHSAERWRSISGQLHTVTEGVGEWDSGAISARAEAVQLGNGELDMSPSDPPGVQVVCLRDNRLTIAEARGLAIALLQAVDEADGWKNR